MNQNSMRFRCNRQISASKNVVAKAPSRGREGLPGTAPGTPLNEGYAPIVSTYDVSINWSSVMPASTSPSDWNHSS